MGVLPGIDAIGLLAAMRCRKGHETGALLMFPVEQRALRAFAHLAGLPAPKCDCKRRLEVTSVTYSFDEPGLPDLIYTTVDGALRCDGHQITAEADLIELIGRPFAPAEYHRARLAPEHDQPDVYQPSPGVTTIAFPTSPGDPSGPLNATSRRSRSPNRS